MSVKKTARWRGNVKEPCPTKEIWIFFANCNCNKYKMFTLQPISQVPANFDTRSTWFHEALSLGSSAASRECWDGWAWRSRDHWSTGPRCPVCEKNRTETNKQTKCPIVRFLVEPVLKVLRLCSGSIKPNRIPDALIKWSVTLWRCLLLFVFLTNMETNRNRYWSICWPSPRNSQSERTLDKSLYKNAIPALQLKPELIVKTCCCLFVTNNIRDDWKKARNTFNRTDGNLFTNGMCRDFRNGRGQL